MAWHGIAWHDQLFTNSPACHVCPYDLPHYRLSSAAYAAIACLAVEYIGLFLGVSLFLRGHNCLYILLHFAGAIVTGLMYTQVGVNKQTAAFGWHEGFKVARWHLLASAAA